MAKKQVRQKRLKDAPKVTNPRYKDATPDMVGRALLRNPPPEKPKEGETEAA